MRVFTFAQRPPFPHIKTYNVIIYNFLNNIIQNSRKNRRWSLKGTQSRDGTETKVVLYSMRLMHGPRRASDFLEHIFYILMFMFVQVALKSVVAFHEWSTGGLHSTNFACGWSPVIYKM
jgi:hypothetical protein